MENTGVSSCRWNISTPAYRRVLDRAVPKLGLSLPGAGLAVSPPGPRRDIAFTPTHLEGRKARH